MSEAGSGLTRSEELYRGPSTLLPGGVNSPVRAMGSIGRDPIFVASGAGAELVDVDGNRYVDWMLSWGPLIAGHAHPQVVEAVTAAAVDGTSFGAPTEAEVDLAAEVVAERVPGAEMVRMVNSGTEAAMSAIRLARAATGRDKLLKFAGAYHGHVDGLLAEAGSGLATAGIPASPGVPAAQAAATVIVPWNDREAVERALAEHEVAAILAEPYPANMGLVPPEEGFLAFLREQADANGALLVFDEVISGFRVARGGAQEREGVTPDLTMLGKVIGGGLPAAAYAGLARADGAGGAGGRRLPGGHAVGESRWPPPPAWRRWSCSTPPPTSASSAVASALADGLRARRRGGRGAGPRDADHRAAHALLPRRAGGRLRGRQGLRHRRPRGLLPRAAGARRVPAAVAVRGLVSLARAHRRARGAHARGRRRGVRGGGRAVSALREVVEAVDPALREHAAADPGPDRFARPVADDDRLFVLEAVYEGYLLHYGEPRAFRGMDADLRLLAGDALYALGLSRLAGQRRSRGGGGAVRPDLGHRAGPGGGARGGRRCACGCASARATQLVTGVAKLTLFFPRR